MKFNQLKKALLSLIVTIFLSLTVHAQYDQRDTINHSTIDLAAGLGSQYGIAGIKCIIGNEKIGFYIGCGRAEGAFAFSVGGVIRAKWWFISPGLGVLSNAGINPLLGDDFTGRTPGIILMTGAHIVNEEQVFFELGIGTAMELESPETFPDQMPILVSIGVGYRFITR